MAGTVADHLAEVVLLLREGNLVQASAHSHVYLPFDPKPAESRSIGFNRSIRIFLRDGFLDRYSGRRLFNPGLLRMLHELLPQQFPFHKNGKTGYCHDIFWDQLPSIDHVRPLQRGGTNDDSNLATTSMARNMAKANFFLEEIGWRMIPAGKLADWDGGSQAFLDLFEKHGSESKYTKEWYRLTKRAL